MAKLAEYTLKEDDYTLRTAARDALKTAFKQGMLIFRPGEPLVSHHSSTARFRDHVKVSWCRVLDAALKTTDGLAIDCLTYITMNHNGELDRLRDLVVPSIPRVLRIALVDDDEDHRETIKDWITSTLTNTTYECAPFDPYHHARSN